MSQVMRRVIARGFDSLPERPARRHRAHVETVAVEAHTCNLGERCARHVEGITCWCQDGAERISHAVEAVETIAHGTGLA